MKKAVEYFNAGTKGIAKRLSLRRLQREPIGHIGADGWSVDYALTERDGAPVLAYFIYHRMTNSQYKEVAADGKVVFSFNPRISGIGIPSEHEKAVAEIQQDIAGYARMASVGIAYAAVLLQMERTLLRNERQRFRRQQRRLAKHANSTQNEL